MCTGYESSNAEKFEAFSVISRPTFHYGREIYEDYTAPIIRHIDDTLQISPATFAMVPKSRMPAGVKVFDTMNAPAETLGQKRSYRGAWNRLQLALIPCKMFYEPDYEMGKAVRWRIGTASGEPLAIAGLWRSWDEPGGDQSLSFTMLTVKANDHSLMKRFFRPGAEKRSLVIISPAHYEDWLTCRNTDEARSFLRLYPAEAMRAEPYPLSSRKAIKLADPAEPLLL